MFFFLTVSKTDTKKEIKSISHKKATTKNNTPPRILQVTKSRLNFLQNLVNDAIIRCKSSPQKEKPF